MKHKTLRCVAETAALLLTVAILAFLIAGLAGQGAFHP